MKFRSILSLPDVVTGATEDSVYRFEEKVGVCNVKYDYLYDEKSAKVVVYPSEKPVRYLKLRFRGDFYGIDKVYGDDWGRSSYLHPLEWKNVLPERTLPWFCYLLRGDDVACYGVKTGANCFASWYVDPKGVTLFLDLSNGSGGTHLTEKIVACEVVELFGNKNQTVFSIATEFAKKMCQSPIFPKEPIFGVNNWYWAYGDISAQSVLDETDYLLKMTQGSKHRPYMIIDDGWQKHRTVGQEGGDYIGGEWTPNEKFGDMSALVEAIHQKGAKAGLWFRPLLTREDVDPAMVLTDGFGGKILDPSHPNVLQKVQQDAKRIASWGFDLIKHDFSQVDTFGSPHDSCFINDDLTKFSKKREFYNKNKTNAMIMKDLYKAIAQGAGNADVIGCNVFGHLSAGIHSIHRVGNDTSGRTFEITRSDGVNSFMRLPTNKTFYLADPDCAAFTPMVDSSLNLDFLEVCAVTGCTTLASVTPWSLSSSQLKRINDIFLLADKNEGDCVIEDYEKTCCPDTFYSPSLSKRFQYDWYRAYEGSRVKFEWVEKEDE